MNKSHALILCALFVAVFLCSGLIWARTNSVHDFTGRCESCHLTSPRQGQKNIFTRDIDTLCIECHEVAVKNSHPTGMVPSMQVPNNFFLDWRGKINCASCHDPHNRDTDMMLRSEARGRAFCESCHHGGLVLGKHVAASSVAHTKNWTAPTTQAFGQILDRVSLECMVCHEGSVGPSAEVRVASVTEQGLSYIGPGFTHPIGIDYAQAAANDRQLRRLDDLSPLISLYEGKVGCASCHNQFSHEGDMLVFSNRSSALCLECHLK